jgi:hypothetical protein
MLRIIGPGKSVWQSEAVEMRFDPPILTSSTASPPINYDTPPMDRCLLKGAKKHSFLIVTHQEGPFKGIPLSQKGLTKIFTKVFWGIGWSGNVPA